MVDIPDVKLETLLPAQGIASVHLGPARDARTHLVSARLLGGVQGQVLHQQRARAHQAHLTAQHVPEFGQFVQAAGAQKTAEGGEALGVGQEFTVGAAFIRHGAKLHHHERPPVQAGADLAKQHGAAELAVHQDPQQQQRQGQHDQSAQRQQQIEQALHPAAFGAA